MRWKSGTQTAAETSLGCCCLGFQDCRVLQAARVEAALAENLVFPPYQAGSHGRYTGELWALFP